MLDRMYLRLFNELVDRCFRDLGEGLFRSHIFGRMTHNIIVLRIGGGSIVGLDGNSHRRVTLL
jgi:putative lipase involved disintegration of autophagic bodies